MAKYANQKTIIKDNGVLMDEEHPYAKISIASWQNAMSELDNYEFKLYTLFYLNQRDFKLDLSPSNLEKTYGGTRKTWSKARKGLEDKGYLVANGNKETFVERPMREMPAVQNSTVAEPVFAQVPWDF